MLIPDSNFEEKRIVKKFARTAPTKSRIGPGLYPFSCFIRFSAQYIHALTHFASPYVVPYCSVLYCVLYRLYHVLRDMGERYHERLSSGNFQAPGILLIFMLESVTKPTCVIPVVRAHITSSGFRAYISLFPRQLCYEMPDRAFFFCDMLLSHHFTFQPD